MRHLRLTRPALTFYVEVTVHERGGRFMATADLGEDSRDVGVGGTPHASEMAVGVNFEPAQ